MRSSSRPCSPTGMRRPTSGNAPEAGDLCMQAKKTERALGYYGRAIDAYLHDGRPELARGVAQKLIRVHPGAVRTYCTLTWLDLGLGHLVDARTHVGG